MQNVRLLARLKLVSVLFVMGTLPLIAVKTIWRSENITARITAAWLEKAPMTYSYVNTLLQIQDALEWAAHYSMKLSTLEVSLATRK